MISTIRPYLRSNGLAGEKRMISPQSDDLENAGALHGANVERGAVNEL
jgi:hypothetical protein